MQWTQYRVSIVLLVLYRSDIFWHHDNIIRPANSPEQPRKTVCKDGLWVFSHILSSHNWRWRDEEYSVGCTQTAMYHLMWHTETLSLCKCPNPSKGSESPNIALKMNCNGNTSIYLKSVTEQPYTCPSYVSYLSLDKATVVQSLHLIKAESEDLFVCLSLGVSECFY